MWTSHTETSRRRHTATKRGSVGRTVTEWLPLEPLALAAVYASVIAGAIIQGAIGFGLNLVVVPVVALTAPEALPASMIVMAIPMTLGSAALERSHIHRLGVI